MLKRYLILFITIMFLWGVNAQTTLEEAVNFHVKTIYGETIWLFPLLDDENKIVVVDFFTTDCGPCQTYAPDFQTCYENFGYNQGNVYFLGINWGDDNQEVYEFDSIFGLTYPTASGTQGGGNTTYLDYDIQSYPTVIVITPDHLIAEQQVWPPDVETITNAVIEAGGMYVNTAENELDENQITVYPNPLYNTGTVKVPCNNIHEAYIEIINSVGQIVYVSDPATCNDNYNSISFPISDLNTGYYFIKAISGKKVIGVKSLSVVE